MLSLLMTSLAISSKVAAHPWKQDDRLSTVKHGLPAGCPKEHFYGVRPSQGANGPNDSFYTVGQTLNFECHRVESTLHFMESADPDEFVVYPSTKRTCQANGTWSGVPPTCVLNDATLPTPNVKPTEMYLCPNVHCPKELENWQRVGLLHSSCSENAPKSKSNLEQMQVYVEFARHVHISYMTFILADVDGRIIRPFDVAVSVHPHDVISKLSDESADYLKNHYDPENTANNQCAITEIAAYTKSLLLSFSVEKTSAGSQTGPLQTRWRPQPFFYSVQELTEKRKLKLVGNGCQRAPSIPNGFVKESRDEGNLTYACDPGFVMIDPRTYQTSNGRLECHNSFEWVPYPFPICVPSSAEYSKDPETAVNITVELNNERERESNAESGRMVIAYILAASLFVLGIIFGSIITVCLKNRTSRAVHVFDGNSAGTYEKFVSGEHTNQGGCKKTGNRLNVTFTFVSTDSLQDSSSTEHVYESVSYTNTLLG